MIVIHLKVQGTESAQEEKKRQRNNERQDVIVVKKQKKKKNKKKSPQRLSCLGISATLMKFSIVSLDRE